MNKESSSQRARFYDSVWFKSLGGIVFLITIFYSASAYIDRRIESKFNNEQFIRKVSSELRPYFIIDENGSILYDAGGMQFIESIQVMNRDTNTLNKKCPVTDNIPRFTFVVSPKVFLRAAPIIQCLSQSEIIFAQPKRGDKYDWIVDTQFQYARNYSGPLAFRVEMLR